MKKAKLSSVTYEEGKKYLWYTYMGRFYGVCDYGLGYGDTLAQQHKKEQARIEKELKETLLIPIPVDKTKAEIAFDELWKMWEEEENEITE